MRSFDAARFDMVRAGVVLYGVRPSDDSDVDVRSVMRVVTSVARVETIAAGTSVGYHRTWTAERPSPNTPADRCTVWCTSVEA